MRERTMKVKRIAILLLAALLCIGLLIVCGGNSSDADALSTGPADTENRQGTQSEGGTEESTQPNLNTPAPDASAEDLSLNGKKEMPIPKGFHGDQPSQAETQTSQAESQPTQPAQPTEPEQPTPSTPAPREATPEDMPNPTAEATEPAPTAASGRRDTPEDMP